ncbi:hypothetical protein KQX54_013010 [Cotesia glomerata]|uniref:Uncharacterized protein n=1 Tax=Cotesia glomerata TaxID=32391 RepID=A0AAV7J1F8_COTGL|nr:hypothetical protein KQX54_013010 [Cotesia glomerata]
MVWSVLREADTQTAATRRREREGRKEEGRESTLVRVSAKLGLGGREGVGYGFQGGERGGVEGKKTSSLESIVRFVRPKCERTTGWVPGPALCSRRNVGRRNTSPSQGCASLRVGAGGTPAPPNQTTLIGRTNPVSYLSDGFGLLPPRPHPHPHNGSTKPPPHYLQPTTYCFATSPPLVLPVPPSDFPHIAISDVGVTETASCAPKKVLRWLLCLHHQVAPLLSYLASSCGPRSLAISIKYKFGSNTAYRGLMNLRYDPYKTPGMPHYSTDSVALERIFAELEEYHPSFLSSQPTPIPVQSDIHRKVVYSEKVTPLLDKIRESDFDTGYESFTSESGDLIGNLEMQIEQVIDRFAEAAAETQNTSLQEKDSVIEVPKTSIQENHVVDAPQTRRGRPRRHRVKFKERRLSPHEVTPLLDPDTNSEPDSAVGEDTSSESVDSINDLLQHKDNTIQFPKDNTVQVLNSNRQPDDEGLRIQKLSDTRLNSRFTDTRQVYWTQKTNTNNFDLEIHKWKARSKLKKPTVKLKGLFKRVLAPAAMAA